MFEREGSKPRQFSLDRAPELRGMLTSSELCCRAIAKTRPPFLGDDDRQRRSWQMELTPRDRKLKTRLALIRVDGAKGNPRCFTIVEPDGDASLMALGIQDRTALPAALERQSLQAWCTDHATVQ